MIKSPFTKLLNFLLALSLLTSSLVYGIISPPLSKSGSSTLGANHSGHNRKQTTFASLGGGNIQIGGKKQSQADLKKQGLNTDITKTQKITKDQQTGGLNASVTVDHRLASEQGRQQIANDVEDTYEHGEDIGNTLKVLSQDKENKLSILNFGEILHNNAQATQLKNDLLRNPDNQHILAGLKSDNPEEVANAVKELGQLAQAKFGLTLSDINLYDGKNTSSGSLGDNALVDVKGGTVADSNHKEHGNIFIDGTDNTKDKDKINTLGHEVLETQGLQGKNSGLGLFSNSKDQQEKVNNAFGNRFAKRIDQATGGELGKRRTDFSGTNALAQGTQRANGVNTYKVNHRALNKFEIRDINRIAKDFAKKQNITEQDAKIRLYTEGYRKTDRKYYEGHAQYDREAEKALRKISKPFKAEGETHLSFAGGKYYNDPNKFKNDPAFKGIKNTLNLQSGLSLQGKIAEAQDYAISAIANGSWKGVVNSIFPLVKTNNPDEEMVAEQIGKLTTTVLTPLGITSGQGVSNSQKLKILDRFKFWKPKKQDPLLEVLSKAKPTEGHPNQVMNQLDDGTKILFRKDFDNQAHSLGGAFQGKGKIDHYNVQVQNSKGKTIENLHIVPDGKGGFIKWGKDGIVK